MAEQHQTSPGPNLQRIAEAGILTDEGIAKLSAQQRNEIERLYPGQVQTLIDVYRLVGEVMGSKLI